MEKTELILKELRALGLELEEVTDIGFHFICENSHFLFMPCENDENFLRFAIPGIFEVTEENRLFLLDIANKTNMDLKYVKAVIMDNETLWLFLEYRMVGEQSLDELLEFIIRMLLYCKQYVIRHIHGDDDETPFGVTEEVILDEESAEADN